MSGVGEPGVTAHCGELKEGTGTREEAEELAHPKEPLLWVFLLLRPGKGPRFQASLTSDFSGRLLQNEGDHAICPVYLLNSSHERLEKNRATGLLRASQACGAEGRVDDVVSTAA